MKMRASDIGAAQSSPASLGIDFRASKEWATFRAEFPEVSDPIERALADHAEQIGRLKGNGEALERIGAASFVFWQRSIRTIYILAAAIVLGGLLMGGIYDVAGTTGGAVAYVQNRFTGSTWLCGPQGCRYLGAEKQ